MATETPLLRLPMELRLKIYEELLCPYPAQRLRLYHDRHGRKKSMNLHPAILCANKQIHDEATELLYDGNIFEIWLATRVVIQCTGGSYPDSLVDPPPLLQEEPACETSSVAESEACQNKERRYRTSAELGIISPHSLRRMRHIRLITSPSALWGHRRGPGFCTDIWDTILEILECLCKGDRTTPPNSLDLILMSGSWDYDSSESGDARVEGAPSLELASKLVALERTRVLNVEEHIKSWYSSDSKYVALDVKELVNKVAGAEKRVVDTRLSRHR